MDGNTRAEQAGNAANTVEMVALAPTGIAGEKESTESMTEYNYNKVSVFFSIVVMLFAEVILAICLHRYNTANSICNRNATDSNSALAGNESRLSLDGRTNLTDNARSLDFFCQDNTDLILMIMGSLFVIISTAMICINVEHCAKVNKALTKNTPDIENDSAPLPRDRMHHTAESAPATLHSTSPSFCCTGKDREEDIEGGNFLQH